MAAVPPAPPPSLMASHGVHPLSYLCTHQLFISSVVIQSGMSVHDSIALMVMHMPAVSSSVSWLCLDSQSAMNNCVQGLFCILTIYWWILNDILYSLCDKLATFFLKIPTRVLWSVIMLTTWAQLQCCNCYHADHMGTVAVLQFFQDHGICLGFLFLCHYSGFLHLWGSCLYMLLAMVLHLWVLHSLGTICHPSLKEEHPMHLLLDIVVLSHYSVPWLHSFWCFGSVI